MKFIIPFSCQLSCSLTQIMSLEVLTFLAVVDPTGDLHEYGPVIIISFSDPDTKFNLTEYVSGCGDPPYYRGALLAMSRISYYDVALQSFAMEDATDALTTTSTWTSETACAGKRSYYKFYTTRATNMAPGSFSIDNTTCTGSNPQDVCAASVTVKFDSSLVTKQTSSRGMDTLQIFIDEGSIVGGILFFTWFLGIFVI